ncbi:MAG: cohesin domain-containing protein [Anaerolineae bacterium]
MLLSLALCLSPLAANTPARAAQPLPTVRLSIHPATASPRVGDTVAVEARVQGAPALAGVALRLHFDATRLRVVETAPGVLIDRSGFFTPTVVLANSVNNSAGLIAYDGVRASPYPAGDGTLFRVTFKTQQEGSASIAWQAADTALVTPDGLRLPLDLVDAGMEILPAATCRDLVRNGAFEDASAWQYSGFPPWRWCGVPYNPTCAAWLGDYEGAASDDVLWQEVSLPADVVAATLRFRLHVDSHGVPDINDQLMVQVRDAGGNLLETLYTVSGAGPVGTEDPWIWSPDLDMASYAGQAVRVTFRAVCNNVNRTGFYLDDVSLTACRIGNWNSGNSVFLPLVIR